jgi:flagellar hook protein FlgE
MNAQSNRLGTVADKRASTEFSSFIPASATAEYVSGSVTTDIRRAISQQGNLSYTTSVTDLAVNGNGFFVVSDAGGTPYLTRAGSFVKNGDGELSNAAGYFLMGYPLDEGTPAIVANGTAGLERVTISDLALTATPSTEGVFNANLPADAAIIAAADLPSANAATAAYTAKTSLVATADLGRQVTLDIYWAKTAADTWEITVYDRAAQAATGEFPYSGRQQSAARPVGEQPAGR